MSNQPSYTLAITTIQPYRDVIQRPAVNQSLMSWTYLIKVHFLALSQTIDENMEQDSPQVKTQRNSVCNWPPSRVHTVNPFPSDSTAQPALYQATDPPIYTVTSLFEHRGALIIRVKSLCRPERKKNTTLLHP